MSLLPSEFVELEPFARKWCKPPEDKRWAERLAGQPKVPHAGAAKVSFVTEPLL